MRCRSQHWLPPRGSGDRLRVLDARLQQPPAHGSFGLHLPALFQGASRRLKRFTRHEWVYELSPDGWTYAYIMTHVREGNRVLMYQGFLRAFGLQQDSRFSYLVLRHVKRYYMVLGAGGPSTSHPATHRVVGSSTPETLSDPVDSTPMKRLQSLLMIEGEDIANVVFDRLGMAGMDLSWKGLGPLVQDDVLISQAVPQEEWDRIKRLFEAE